MKSIEIQTSTAHRTLGKLKITFGVKANGEFFLDTIEHWYQSPVYRHRVGYVVHFFFSRKFGCWQFNFCERKWSNGWHRDWGYDSDVDLSKFLPALEEFANSDEMRQIADRLLKQWQRRIQNARRQLKAAHGEMSE